MIPFPYKTFIRFNSTFTWVRFPKGDDGYFFEKGEEAWHLLVTEFYGH